MLITSLVFTLISYVAFAIDDSVIERHGSNHIWISIIPFSLLFIRYSFISLMGKYSGDPTEAILKDLILQILSFIWVIIILKDLWELCLMTLLQAFMQS